jgi:hypothetical protein
VNVNWRRLALRSTATLMLLGAVLNPIHVPAQDAGAYRINAYRYVLDVDVPEPAALVALDLAGSRALRASAPKPLSAYVGQSFVRSLEPSAAALDVSPGFLAGAGRMSLATYAQNTLVGRLRRVALKTVLSGAIASEHGSAAPLQVGLAVRSTIHDPHDPILNWGLADSVRQRGWDPETAAPADNESEGRDLFRRARAAVRARCCNQIALGWAAAFDLRNGAADGASALRHQVWGTFQITTGPHYDLLVTPRLLDVFGDLRTALAVGAQRKGLRADLQAELYYDSRGDFLPGASVDIHLLQFVALRGSLSADQRGSRRSLRSGIQLQAYLAQRS